MQKNPKHSPIDSKLFEKHVVSREMPKKTSEFGALRQLMNKFIYQSTNASTLKGT